MPRSGILFRSRSSGIPFHRADIDPLEIAHTEPETVPYCFWQITLGHGIETQTSVEIHQFRLRVHIEGLLSSALLNKEKHDRTGKSTATVLVQDIDRVDFKTVRMAGTPCHTYQFGACKGSKEPIINLVSGLLMVVDPELPLQVSC
jgi:hypothetical protein